MKKLLYSLAALFGISVSVLAQAPPGYPNSFYNMWSSNILVSSPTMTNELRPGQMTLRVTPTSVFPLIRFIGTNSVGTIKLYDATPNTLELATDVIVDGNLTALGTVTGSAIVYSLTNITTATNAWFATNSPDGQLLASTNYIRTNLVSGTLINYATNAQTTTVDMSIPYGDVDVAGGITFAGLSNTKDTAYQTAVVFVKNTTGVEASIVIPTAWTNTAGPLRVTNYTICTIFRNPGRFTNIVTLPVW